MLPTTTPKMFLPPFSIEIHDVEIPSYLSSRTDSMLAPFSLITRALPWTRWHQEPLETDVVEYGNRGLPSVIPGGSPFSYCDTSRPTDLFDISSITLWPQPLYM